MAEIALVASIITVADASLKVISKAAEYGRAVKNAKEDLAKVENEVKDLYTILIKLRDLVERLEKAGCQLDKWTVLCSIKLKGGPLERTKSALDSLLIQLPSVNRLGRWKERRQWPDKCKEIQGVLEVVNKQKEAFLEALNIEQAGQVLETGDAVSKMARVQNRAHDTEVLQWLSSTDFGANHGKARQRHEPKTGAWFLGSDEFQNWKAAENSLLWLHGFAGSGKTILSSTVIHELDSMCGSNFSRALAYFYFDFNDREKQQVATLVRSIAMQLCAMRDPIPEIVLSLYDGSKGTQQPTVEKLITIFPSLTEGLRDVYIVLDALDECSEREHLLRVMTDINRHKIANLHVLVTSRKETDIEATMTALHAPQVSIRGAKIDHDIRLYVQKRLDEDRKLSGWPDSAKQEIRDTLVDKADGMFRWVYCQIEALRMCQTLNDLHKALQQLPKTLDETYERILKAIPEEYAAKAHATLQWLAFSERPLSLEEVAEAATLQPRQCSLDPGESLQSPELILEICGSLVTEFQEYSVKELRFAHYSVKEYLLSSRIRERLSSQFAVLDTDAHAFIVDVCLSYLLLFDQPDSLSEDTPQAHPLLKYVAEYWPSHFHQVPPDRATPTMELLEKLVDVDRRAPLLNCLRIYDHDNLRSSYVRKRNLDKKASDLASPLYYASLWSFTDFARMLIDNGAKVNAEGGCFGNPLQAAVHEGHEAMARLLLEKGADPNLQGGNFGTALQAASDQGDEVLVRLLLENDADPNLQGGQYRTALQAASACGAVDVVRLLLEKDADPNLQGGTYGTALQAASYSGEIDIVRLLLEKGADPNLQGGGPYGTALQAASYEGYVEVVRLLLEKNANPNLQGRGIYSTALQAASSRGAIDIIRLLLEKGADPNLQGGEYRTALQAASHHGEIDIFRLLLEKGADPNLQGGSYETALQIASFVGYIDIVRLLLEKGADPNLQEEYGTALQAASYWGRIDVVRLLLEKGADPNHQGGYCKTALQAASFGGAIDVVRLLLEKGTDPNHQGGYYGTALQAASCQGHIEVVRLLLEKGADPNLQGGKHGTALQAASYWEEIDIVRLLLEENADPNLQGGKHGNALGAARAGDEEEIAELLQAHGAVTPRQSSPVSSSS